MMELSRQRNGQALLHMVGISGSLLPGSCTRMALDIALQGAQHAGASIQLIDLRDYELPFCAGKIGELEHSEDVVRLRQALQQAQGVILGTPVYHGSFSGVLKNALDAMGFEEFEGKIIGLVGVSGGALGAADALTGLQVVSRSLHAWVIPQQVSIAEAWKVFEADGKIKDHGVERRLKRLASRWYASRICTRQSRRSSSYINGKKRLPIQEAARACKCRLRRSRGSQADAVAVGYISIAERNTSTKKLTI